MKRPQLISPGSLNRMIAEAAGAWNRGDWPQSLELLERAAKFDPANIHILLNLGERYGFRYRSADAERCFDKAARLAPNKTEVLATAGRLAAGFGDYPLAERFFRSALEQKNVSADTVARLAEIYERLRRADDAAALVAHALRLDPADPLARLTQAKLHRSAGEMAEAEAVLRPALTCASRELRSRCFYELGALCDRQGRYDDAMAAWLEAKNCLRPDAPAQLAQLQPIIRHLQEMRENVSAEMLARWHASGREALQPWHRVALLAGHARSGTTLLEQVLDSHPDLVSAEETEIFTNEAYLPLRRNLPPETSMLAGLDAAPANELHRSRENFYRTMESHIGSPLNGRLLIDKNPGRHYLMPAMVRILPEIKFLVALRDPRDVVLSCFMQPHPISTGTVEFLDLGNSVTRYGRVMGMWQTLKPLLPNPVLEVRYEDMVADLESVARQSLDFLGVPWDAKVLGFDEHARNKLVRSPTYADVTQKIYKRAQGRWQHYQKYLEPHLAKLEPFVKAFGYG